MQKLTVGINDLDVYTLGILKDAGFGNSFYIEFEENQKVDLEKLEFNTRKKTSQYNLVKMGIYEKCLDLLYKLCTKKSYSKDNVEDFKMFCALRFCFNKDDKFSDKSCLLFKIKQCFPSLYNQYETEVINDLKEKGKLDFFKVKVTGREEDWISILSSMACQLEPKLTRDIAYTIMDKLSIIEGLSEKLGTRCMFGICNYKCSLRSEKVL